jgi:hypothetical protein
LLSLFLLFFISFFMISYSPISFLLLLSYTNLKRC